MKKLSIHIENMKENLELDKSLEISKGSTLFVKNITVFWDYKNIFKGFNSSVLYNGVKHTFSEGYWTFDMIVKRFSDINAGIVLVKNSYNNTCTLTTNETLILYRFGKLLGFGEKATLKAGLTKTSEKVDINRGLKFIDIHCDSLVDETINTKGKRSSVIATIPITTDAPLTGSVTQYVDVESKCSVRAGIYNNLSFHVKPNIDLSDHSIGDVLVNLYIVK